MGQGSNSVPVIIEAFCSWKLKMFLQMPCKTKTDDFDLQVRINKTTQHCISSCSLVLPIEQGSKLREESLGASDTFYRNSPLYTPCHRLPSSYSVSLESWFGIVQNEAIIYTLICIHFMCYIKDLVYNNSQFMIA